MCKTGIMYQSGCDICYVFLTPHRSVELGLRSAYLSEEVQRNRDIRTGVKEKQMYGNRKSDKEWRKKTARTRRRKKKLLHVLDSSGDVQTSDAWCWKLARVYVGHFSHSSIYVFQVLSLHYQDRLGRVKVELWKIETSDR